jgi:hypothetical protein
MVAELESTAAAEISVFHGLLLLNGTNPPKLAVCPAFITLQARLPTMGLLGDEGAGVPPQPARKGISNMVKPNNSRGLHGERWGNMA